MISDKKNKRLINLISYVIIAAMLTGCGFGDIMPANGNTVGTQDGAAVNDAAGENGIGQSGDGQNGSGGNDLADNGSGSVSEEDDVELIDPVGTILKYETASFRELSVVSTYQGVVCPDTYQFAYESDQPFGNYCYLPGDEVSAGEMLFYGTVEGIDDSIEEIEETNAAILEDYNNYVADYLIDVAKARKSEFEAASGYQDMVNNAPPETSDWYAGWAKSVMPVEYRYKQAKSAREKMEEAYRERQELFDLEYAYNETRISHLIDKKNEAGIESPVDGVVVAANYFSSGDVIPMGTDIIAVGDPSDKEIKCEYVSKSVVNKAEEIYALIDGEKHEVVYENMEPEEYRRLKAKEDEVYTTFKLAGNTDSIKLGQYVVIVVVESSNKNTLCVPKGAVSKDDNGNFVYLYDGDDTVYTPVTTGKSDSAFIEILSGLKEGDKVVFDAPYDLGSKTEVIGKGEVHTDFSTDGYLLYPNAEWIKNPAKNGTCYLNKICVDRFEQITEGQTLAIIEVMSDTIEIERIKRKISRQNERIADLNEQKKNTADKDEIETIDRAIRDRNRTITDLNRQLEKAGKYTGVVELKAPYNGLVTDVNVLLKPGQIINSGDKLIQIANDDSCYITVDDKGGILSYGDEATVICKDNTGNTYETVGTVVSLNPYGLPKSLRTGYALVRVSQEDMNAMTGSGSENSNGYWYRIRFTVKAKCRSMTDVLLIPKTAVYKVGNDTYVITKGEDGQVNLVHFVAGGSDNANYYVAYGEITEGMTICWG